MHEIHCVVSGRVQVVMYRDFAARNARRLRLVGYVKNMPDGTVEVVAQGERIALERLVEKLRHGPLLSRVDGVRVEWREPRERFDGFRITY